MQIDQALERVRHPAFRARLLAKRLEVYVNMLCDQEKEYDHRVNESEEVIRGAIRDGFANVRRTPGALESKLSCYYHIGLLCAHEGRYGAARSMFAKTIELSEIYGMSGLTQKARAEMHRVSQPD